MQDKNIIISIDTSGIRQARVILENMAGTVVGECFMEGKSQTVLLALEKVLSDAHVSLEDVKGLRVHTGPGSFTGLRVGIAVAKTLGLLLGITINDTKPWETTDVLYEKDKFAHNPLQG